MYQSVEAAVTPLEWWLAQNNVEYAACLLPSLEHIEYGVHLVYALGNDGMIAQATIRTEDSERDRANSEVVQLVYLGRFLRAARMAEAAGKPVR